MISLNADIDDERAQRWLASADGRFMAHLDAALARGAQELARNARRRSPKAFSTLVNSIRAERVGELHYQVSTGTNYARAVEEGRRPGKMPGTRNGLMEWVRQKVGVTGKALDQVTFLIARAIGRRGIRPQPYMLPAVEETTPRLHELIAAAVARTAGEAGNA